jgi:hypothetical protein
MNLARIGLVLSLSLTPAALAAPSPADSPLQGTWTLVAADKILPSGEQVRDYGASPKGRLIVDAGGRYSLQIFQSERPPFAAPDKAKGTAEEFKAAVLGSSTHFGSITVDHGSGTLTFAIEGASFPNWEGTVQTRSYTLKEDLLTYRVPPRPDGSVPVSVWQRQQQP